MDGQLDGQMGGIIAVPVSGGIVHARVRDVEGVVLGSGLSGDRPGFPSPDDETAEAEEASEAAASSASDAPSAAPSGMETPVLTPGILSVPSVPGVPVAPVAEGEGTHAN